MPPPLLLLQAPDVIVINFTAVIYLEFEKRTFVRFSNLNLILERTLKSTLKSFFLHYIVCFRVLTTVLFVADAKRSSI
jgi:hypothetical protein